MIESSDCHGKFGDARRTNRPTRPSRRPPALLLAIAAAGLVGVPAASAEAPATAVLTMRLALKNGEGQVGCLLFASEKGFPKDPDAALQRKWCSITRTESVCPFDPVAAGTYAVACFHDENKNGKLDTGLFGIPTEGTVASNHAKGFMGPPSFADARFRFLAVPAELRSTMGY